MVEDPEVVNGQRKLVKVVIAQPNQSYIQTEAFDNRMLMAIHWGTLQEKSKHEPVTPDKAIFEFYHFTAGRLLTPAAREALADHALIAKVDYMLMVDDDMICPIDMFETLYNHHVDIVAPLAFTRNEPHMAVIYQQETGFDPVSKQEYFINRFARNYPKDKLVRCDAVGFGAVLIDMRVLHKMRKPYFMSTCGTGEDVYFCYRAYQQAGAKIYMDTACKLGHMAKPKLIDEPYAEWYWKNMENKDITKMEARYNAERFAKV